MPNAIEQIYDQIGQVLGGTNPDQLLSMVMPGTTLDAKSYAYDTTQMKPAIVQEAESRLTDQMFDLAKVSGSSNGQRVSSQFLQALSVLTPNFNYMMPVMKDALRDFINAPMPANTLLDGKPFAGTLQEYYFKLYDNYIAVKQAWETRIVEKKDELASDRASENEKYLEWYEQIAEGELLKIDEALGKVLAVFSPADMDAILGALAAGPGGEIQEASNTVKDIQLASPDGGYFYPVDLTPDDWFLDLPSDLDPANLLQDPAFIADAINTKRQALLASISQVQAMLNDMPTKGDIKAAAEKLQVAQNAYVQAQNNLVSSYADNTVAAVNMYLQMETGGVAGGGDTDEEILGDLNTEAKKVDKAKGGDGTKGATKKDGTALVAADVQTLLTGQKTLIGAQSALQTSSQAVADAGMNLASQQASYFGDLPLILARMQAQLADLVNQQNDLGAAMGPGVTPLPKLGNAPAKPVPATVNKSETSQRFMDLQMSFSTSDMEASASTDTSFSQTSWSVDLFFGSASGSSSSSSAVTAKNSFDTKTEIQVAFKAAKIDIERDWLDPGIFKLSKDMSRLSTTKVSEGALPTKSVKDSSGNTSTVIDWPNVPALNSALFPSFPVAFIVVKDVNITFNATESSLKAVQTVLDSKSAVGGGFLCFSASSSSASHSDHSSTSVKSEGTTIRISMPGPQILAWYLEMTPADQSTVLSSSDAGSGTADINILQFVKQLAKLKGQLTQSVTQPGFALQLN